MKGFWKKFGSCMASVFLFWPRMFNRLFITFARHAFRWSERGFPVLYRALMIFLFGAKIVLIGLGCLLLIPFLPFMLIGTFVYVLFLSLRNEIKSGAPTFQRLWTFIRSELKAVFLALYSPIRFLVACGRAFAQAVKDFSAKDKIQAHAKHISEFFMISDNIRRFFSWC